MVVMLDETRPCQRCGAAKPIADFKRNQWGPGSVCNACVGRKMTLAAERRRNPDAPSRHHEMLAELVAARRRVRTIEAELTAAEDERDRLIRRLTAMPMMRPVGRRAKVLGLPGSEHAR